MRNADEGAFPVPTVTGLPNGEFIHGVPGLTKRELLAGMAMQGICANTLLCTQNIPAPAIAAWSVEQADALLAELAKPVLP